MDHHHLYHTNVHIPNTMQLVNTSTRAISFVMEPPSPASLSHNSSSFRASMIDPYANMRRFSEGDCNQECPSLPGPSSRSPHHKSSAHLYHRRKLPSGQVDRNDPAYREKRERNNEAVKKSREKKKKESEKVYKDVQHLERENERLKTNLLKQKTSYETLKDLYEAACGKMSPGTEQKLFQRHE